MERDIVCDFGRFLRAVLAAPSRVLRGAFLNFLGKAAFGYFGCAAIARPLQDSRRPTS
jgi:hypothetical protein